MVSGVEEDLKIVQEAICAKYLTKVRGIVGPDPGDTKSIVILNSILEWGANGITLEADQRHTELILKQMGMEKCKGREIAGSGVKPDEEGEQLDTAQARQFRSMAARCNFLSPDRIDLQFACKGTCRKMSSPCEGDWVMLKAVARYLQSHPRLLMDFVYQEPP